MTERVGVPSCHQGLQRSENGTHGRGTEAGMAAIIPRREVVVRVVVVGQRG